MTIAAGQVRFHYSRIRLGLWVILAIASVAAGVWQAGRTDGVDRFLAFVLVIVAGAASVFVTRMFLDKRPAVLITEEGLAAQRLGGVLIPWSDIRGVRLHWKKRALFWVIPLNSPELTLSIRLESTYWISDGISRTLMRWLSLASGDDTAVVNLNGLAGGRPDRVIAAIRRMRPDLVRETMVEEIE